MLMDFSGMKAKVHRVKLLLLVLILKMMRGFYRLTLACSSCLL